MTDDPDCVLWLDPGLRTGWAVLDGDRFDAGEGIMPEIGELVEKLATEHGERLAIGWEAFLLAPGGARSATVGPPLEVIGMARWLGYKHRCRMLRPAPSAMRTAVTPGHLKRMGWYTPGADHATQATRHLAAWMLREDLFDNTVKYAVFGTD